MRFVLELRRATSLVVATLGLSSLPACFDVEDVPPLATEGSSTGSTPASTSTTDPGVTSIDPDTSTGSIDPDTSTGSVDPDTSTSTNTTSVDPDTSGSSSSGAPLDPVCGDGLLDPTTEACDDGNLVPGDLCDDLCQVETVVFTFTGGVQQLDVPAWVDSLTVEAWGAEGGDSVCCEGPDDDGGLGGYVSGVLPAVGGTTIQIRVGGQGAVEGVGGFNGGGNGGQYAAGGGGATDIRLAPGMLTDRVLVAGGGGGGNCGCPDHGGGGNGGGLSGQAGISNQGFVSGGGGTQAAGGAAGSNATAGSLGQGGSTAAGDFYHMAGGGGGYYGGGGAYAAGGGGGSSYLGTLRNGLTMPGIREGNGEVHLTPIAIQ